MSKLFIVFCTLFSISQIAFPQAQNIPKANSATQAQNLPKANNSARPLILSYACSVVFAKQDKNGITYGFPEKNNKKLVEIKNVNTPNVFYDQNNFSLAVALESYSTPPADQLLNGHKSNLQLKLVAIDKTKGKEAHFEARASYMSNVSMMMSGSHNVMVDCQPTVF